MRLRAVLLLLLAFSEYYGQDLKVVKGVITTYDSNEVVSFAYVYAKSSGRGVMSNLNGFFQLSLHKSDTLIIRHSEFEVWKMPERYMADSPVVFLNVRLKRKYISLPEIKIMDYSLKPYEKERMDRIIRQSRMSVVTSIQSPITALYFAFSRRGQEIRKLARIYEEILLEEKIREKLSPETLRQLTGDAELDYESFRRFCFEIKEEDYLFLDNYTLYKKVLDCYRRYRRER